MWVAGAPETSPELESHRAVAAVAHALEKLVERNDRIAGEAAAAAGGMEGRGRGLAVFRGPRRPAVSIGNYLERIQRYGRCSSACIVAGFVYVDRAVHRRPESVVGSLNVHRMMLAGVMIAAKFFEVMPQSNAFYAKVGGVSNAELNLLELELLFLLDFRLNISSHEFESYRSHLNKEMASIKLDKKLTSINLDIDDGEAESPKVDGVIHI